MCIRDRFITFTLSMHAGSQTKPSLVLIEQNNTEIIISIYGNTLRVEGASNQTLYIYNVTGVKIMSIKIDGQDKRYTLNLPKGCYIIKVGNVVRKISIR